MGLIYNLQITETSIDEFKAQLKHAYEQFFGPVVETPKQEATQTVAKEAPVLEEKIVRAKKRVGRPRASQFNGPCKDCGTTTTPQWRRKTMPEGPLCNACHLRRKKSVKAGKAPKEDKVAESSKDRSARIRAEKMVKTVKNRKAPMPRTAVKEESFVPAPKEEPQLTVGTYLTWCEHNVPGIIMRDKAFLVASKVIETWFNGLKAQSEFNDWMLENQESFVNATQKVFEAFQAANPTAFMIHDVEDNVVLMINKPQSLNMKDLSKVRWD